MSLPNKLSSRQINQEFMSGLEIRDQAPYKDPRMPGSIIKSYGIDPRIGTISNISQPLEETILAERLATLIHKPSGRVFIVYQDTIDALYLENQDLIKYPKWLMEEKRKQNERSIRINEMIRAPKDKYDREWLKEIPESDYDTIVYYLFPKTREE